MMALAVGIDEKKTQLCGSFFIYRLEVYRLDKQAFRQGPRNH